jgi:hypothetical protein
MKRFLSVDDLGYVYGYTITPESPGEDWIEIEFDASDAVTSLTRFRFVDGELVDTGISKLPPRPFMRWVDGAWADIRDLEQKKSDKWDEVKSARDGAEHGGFTWDGSVFDSDPAAQTKIIGATQLANMSPASFLMDWTLKDNTVRTLTGAQMISVGQALGVHVNAQHVLGRTLRQQIEAATTASEVAAIHWPE